MWARMALIATTMMVLVWTPVLGKTPESVVLVTQDLCPYGCSDEEGVFDGFFVRKVRRAFEQMGVSLQLVVVPWRRALHMVEAGDAQGYFPAYRGAQRDAEGQVFVQLDDDGWNWFLLRESPLDPLADSFKKSAKVAGIRGGAMQKWLQDNGYNMSKCPAAVGELVEMLVVGRFDAILDSRHTVQDILRRRGLEKKVRVVQMKTSPWGCIFQRNLFTGIRTS